MNVADLQLDSDFRKLIKNGMKAGADDVSILVGVQLRAATRKMVSGDEALDAMGERFYVCQTRRVLDLDAPAGFVAREADVYGLAAKMLMMPGWDEDSKEELAMAFEEVVPAERRCRPGGRCVLRSWRRSRSPPLRRGPTPPSRPRSRSSSR